MRSVLVLIFEPHTYSERRMFMCVLCMLGMNMPSGKRSSACPLGAADTSSASGRRAVLPVLAAETP